jgi:hypothetical protein
MMRWATTTRRWKRIRVGKGDKYGFLDEHAREVIPVQYEYAEIFDKGKARVMLNGREFFIDPNGRRWRNSRGPSADRDRTAV